MARRNKVGKFAAKRGREESGNGDGEGLQDPPAQLGNVHRVSYKGTLLRRC